MPCDEISEKKTPVSPLKKLSITSSNKIPCQTKNNSENLHPLESHINRADIKAIMKKKY